MLAYHRLLAIVFVLLNAVFIPGGYSVAQTELPAQLTVSTSNVLFENVQALKAKGATSATFTDINSLEDVEALNLSQRHTLQKEIALADTFSATIPNPCTEYYEFGSVVSTLEVDPSAIVSGSEKQFTLKITNNNEYPIVGASVPVKVYAVDAVNTQKILSLVDEFVALTNIQVRAGATSEHTFSYDTPVGLPTGTYEVVPYLTVADTYHVVGMPFTDDVRGGSAVITVEGGSANRLTFNRDLVFLNNTQYDFTALSPQFSKEAPIRVTVPIFNELDAPLDATVTWKLYKYDQYTEAHLLETATQTVSIGVGDSVTATHLVTDTEHSAYLLRGEVVHLGTSSIVDIRFMRTGVSDARINFAGLLNYPKVTEEKDITLFACAQATGDTDVSGAEITMTVTDETGKVLHTETFSEAITTTQTLFASSFARKAAYQSLTLTTTLSLNQKLLSSTAVTYECGALADTGCQEEGGVLTNVLFQKILSPLTALAALSLVTLFFLIRRQRQKHAKRDEIEYTKPLMLLAALFLGSMSMLMPQEVQAQLVWGSPQFVYSDVFDGACANTPLTPLSGACPVAGDINNLFLQVGNSCGSCPACSTTYTAYTQTCLATLPVAPPTPTVTPTFCGGSLNINIDAVSGATGYDVQYRLSSGGSWTEVSNVPRSYRLDGLLIGSAYDIQVRAKNSAGNSPWSGTGSANATIQCAPDPFVFADSACVPGQHSLVWSTVPSTLYYELRVGNPVTPLIFEYINVGNVTSFDHVVPIGSTRTYKIRSITAAGTSEWSSWSGIATLPTSCLAPGGLAAVPQSCASGQINVTWNSVSSSFGYDISINGGSWFDAGFSPSYGLTSRYKLYLSSPYSW
jgi:Fibronectin type III domain